MGRDVWSRLVYGTRMSLAVALGALAVGGVLGTTLGFVLAHCRGPWGSLLRITFPWYATIILNIVAICVVVLIITVIGTSFINLIIALGLATWPRYVKSAYAKVKRLPTLTLRCPGNETEHSTAESAADASTNRVTPLATLVPLQLGFLVIAESILSFLGFGVPPPTPSLGSMLGVGPRRHREFLVGFHYSRGAAIMLLVISFYMLGHRRRDRLNLKTVKKGTIPSPDGSTGPCPSG